MRKSIVVPIMALVIFCYSITPILATVPFMKEFQKLYITPDTDEDYAKLLKGGKTKCLVCHQGKKRKHQNPYGEHLEKLLDKKKDKKDKEKIIAALKKVEKMHSAPDDDQSPTYGDLIEANKLPGGPLEEVQKEPKGNEQDEKEEEEKGESKAEDPA